MKSVSKEFKELMRTNRLFKPYAEFTFPDGSTKTMDENELWVSGNGFVNSPQANAFPLGAAVEQQVTLLLDNSDDQYAEYDFYYATFALYLKFPLSEAVESIRIGEFTITEPESYGDTIEIAAVDNMYKMDADYSTGLTAPFTVGEGLRDACAACGVTLLTTVFKNSNAEITSVPEGLTFREFAGLCAMYAGGNAVMDEYGRLKIVSYDFNTASSDGLYGGIFDSDSPHSTGDDADGGSFNPWDTRYVYDDGDFSKASDIHYIQEYTHLRISTDDVIVTGIQMTEDDKTYLSGVHGYVLEVSNALVSSNYQTFVDMLGDMLIGARFRPFEATGISYPLADFMDPCYIIDRKGTPHPAVITDIDFSFLGSTILKCTADDPIRNSSSYNSVLTTAIVAAKKTAAEQLSAYDQASQQLSILMAQSFGVFTTEEVLTDGSAIYYLHNKPTLAESTTIWKMTADAFAVSTDGGATWNAGIDSSGNELVNVLSAIGINFDWARGGTLTLGGVSNGNGQLVVNDASGKQIGKWNKDGLVATKGTFSGVLSGASGTFAFLYTGSHSSYDSTASGFYAGNEGISLGSAFRVTNTGELTCTAGTFGGTVSGVKGTFTSLYTGSHSSYDSTASGFYGGSEGISLGTAFRVTNAGHLTCTSGNIGGMAVANDGITLGDSTHGVYLPNGGGIGIAYDKNLSHGVLQHYSGSPNIMLNAAGNQLDIGRYQTSYVKVWCTFEDASDKRLKCDITPLNTEKSYGLCMNLRPVSYRWKRDKRHLHHGFIAQDAEAVSDWNLVFTDEEGMKGMAYIDLIADLVGAVQYLGRKVDNLHEQTYKRGN